MSDEPICDSCRTRAAEFEIRKISESSPVPVMHRKLCKSCLGAVLADDTSSIVRITKAGDPAVAPGPAAG